MSKHTIVWAFAALSLFFTAPALATHKAWALSHGGGDCAFQSPKFHPTFGGDGGDLVLRNHWDYNRTAVCPIALAGRWGSSGSVAFGVARWAEAKRAWVRVYNGHSTEAFTCQAVARLRVSNAPGGSLYYGTARSVTGMGNHTIELVSGVDPAQPPWTNWGGTLETNEGARIRSLDIQCTVPKMALGISQVRGYGVSLCQRAGDCQDITIRNETGGGETTIQGNGSSCTSGTGAVYRGADGFSPAQAGSTYVSCPVVPPSQDSYELSGGSMRRVRLFFGGVNGATGCETNGTCPNCVLRWERASDGAEQSSKIFTWKSNGMLEMPQDPNGSWDPDAIPFVSSMSISCSVPAGVRIRGYIAWASQTQISGGL